jgi:hypothetical protein
VSNVTSSGRLARFAGALCLVSASAAILATTAWASGYWNVWQGDLPGSDGVRSAHSAFPGGNNLWYDRVSWTSNTHDMNFSFIGNNGSWTNLSVHTWGTEWTSGSAYDEYLPYGNAAVPSGVAKAGCQNPSGLSTVFTNCRNAGTL